MHFFRFFVRFLILSGALSFKGIVSTASCDSPQYLTFGESGTLNCFFHVGFFSVLWFNTTDYTNNDAILHYQDTKKSGIGYVSGEYDIHPNGSLIINDVSLQQERVFTVAYVYTKKEGPILFNIRVVVVIKPEVPFPVIDSCGNLTKRCYVEVFTPSILCSVSDARPNITLKWMARTVHGDKAIANDLSFVSKDLATTSHVTSEDTFHFSYLLVLLVCKASSTPPSLESNESLVLVQNGDVNLSIKKAVSTSVERNTQIVLNCSEKDLGFVVWKRAALPSGKTYELLLYSVLIGGKFTEILLEDASLGNKGSLIVPHANLNHEGVYYCLHGDGISDGVSVYNVTVFVFPSPPYLMVDECYSNEHCALEVQNEGSLTCSVTAIRPSVQLKWKTFYDRDSTAIDFRKQQLTVKQNGDTFDVVLTTSYRMRDSRDQLTVECTLIQPPEIFLDLHKKVDLLFVNGPSTEHADVPLLSKITLPVVLVIVFLLLLFSIGAVAVIIIIMKRKRNGTKSGSQKEVSSEEEIPMVSSKTSMKDDASSMKQRDIEDMKKTLSNQLKEKYKDLYNAVRPIPYLKERQYCVDTIFVDGGIELRHDEVGIKSKWEKLHSYTDIFDRQRTPFTRLILEGEPGYGKSTIALQLAYDWCNQVQSSHLKDIQILILLRLRQLGGVSSIFTAIKYYLLPYDSELQEVDIKNILTNTESVAIIMDGYDEYPDQDKPSEIMRVFQRNMFQTFQVILTTRLSCVPEKLSPQTRRVRLTGFDDNAQEDYIRKALALRDEENVQNLKLRLQNNPVLSGLCQVPLFFAMYTHITVESEILLNFNSVTSFFQHMVECFHEHMKNKMDDENVEESELFENDHQKLDRIAFEALSKRARPWIKNDLRKRLGKNFYEAYVRIGILVEEETSQFVQNLTSRPIQKETEVRFYHKLFCEWYAAHFLTRFAAKSLSFRLGSMVKKRNPFDLHYLYRFACGLNPSASGKIIKHIKKLKGGDKFAILCLLEQPEYVHDVKETIRQLCAEGIIISNDDSLLLQMSSLQLLEIAANNKIPITVVRLQNSLETVDLSTISIRLKSQLSFSSRIPMEGLQISLTTLEISKEATTEISKDEANAVFEFATKCPSLRALWYLGYTLPQRFEGNPILTALESGNIKVFWRRSEDEPVHVLNVQSGSWELTHGNDCKKWLDIFKDGDER